MPASIELTRYRQRPILRAVYADEEGGELWAETCPQVHTFASFGSSIYHSDQRYIIVGRAYYCGTAYLNLILDPRSKPKGED